MTVLKTLVATIMMAAIPASYALADDPDAFQAQFPDRDVLNGGALTPAGRAGLQAPYGAATSYPASNANAETGGVRPALRAHRHHSRNGHLPRP